MEQGLAQVEVEILLGSESENLMLIGGKKKRGA
jgi:hypothetical protein